jgi:hypothetical protein
MSAAIAAKMACRIFILASTVATFPTSATGSAQRQLWCKGENGLNVRPLIFPAPEQHWIHAEDQMSGLTHCRHHQRRASLSGAEGYRPPLGERSPVEFSNGTAPRPIGPGAVSSVSPLTLGRVSSQCCALWSPSN